VLRIDKSAAVLQFYTIVLGSPWVIPSEFPATHPVISRAHLILFCGASAFMLAISAVVQWTERWHFPAADIIVPFNREGWFSMMYWVIWLYFWGEPLAFPLSRELALPLSVAGHF